MASAIRIEDVYYLYCDYIRYDDPSAPGPFEKRTPILRTGATGSWDSWKVLDPHPIRYKEKFYLYYKGFNSSSMNSRRTGLAISESATGPFEKYEGNPILDWSAGTGIDVALAFHHNGRPGMPLSLTLFNLQITPRNGGRGVALDAGKRCR